MSTIMRSPRILMVHPRFCGTSFWNYQPTLRAVGRRYSNTPLGLATVAALLPESWPIRLIDCNVEELSGADLDWADVVATGGMLSQQADALNLIQAAKARGRYCIVGGPDPTTSPQVYEGADARVLGEAEPVRQQLVEVLAKRKQRTVVEAGEFADLATSPVPRFDLLKLNRYLHVGVQASRGCPHDCEFCNVVNLYGRRPRMKSTTQMLAELDALYTLGYRGHIDFVDDNLISHRRRTKVLLRALIPWLEAHGQPFEFSTEASLDLADDEELLELMCRANFFGIFSGIETTDPVALRDAHKRPNLNRDLIESVRKIQRAGIFVNGGFIIGFDTETASVQDAVVESVESAAMPIAMVGLLYALPGTRLARRLAEEGRLEGLYDDVRLASVDDADQCTSGLNFRTLRPKAEALTDYQQVYRKLYNPAAFYGRVRQLVRMLDRSRSRYRPTLRQVLRDLRAFVHVCTQAGWRSPETRREYWLSLGDALVHNPSAIRTTVLMAALYLHFGPFSQHVDRIVERRLAGSAQG